MREPSPARQPSGKPSSGEPSSGEHSPGDPLGDPPGDPLGGAPAAGRVGKVRRAPRYRAFILTGLLAGVTLGTVLSLVVPGGDGSYSTGAVLVYLDGVTALLGAAAGAALAVLVERPGRR